MRIACSDSERYVVWYQMNPDFEGRVKLLRNKTVVLRRWLGLCHAKLWFHQLS